MYSGMENSCYIPDRDRDNSLQTRPGAPLSCLKPEAAQSLLAMHGALLVHPLYIFTAWCLDPKAQYIHKYFVSYEDIHNLYSLLNIFRVNESKKED
jgi:hypothetical protein